MKSDTIGNMNVKQRQSALYALLLSLCLFVSVTFSAHAASLYLEPANGTYAQGNTFSIKVRVDNQNECINAVNVRIAYPSESIRVVDVARGDSILTLWTEEPSFDNENGIVHFSGGLPGGYCGRVEGDSGYTNMLAEIIFQVPGFIIGEGGPGVGAISFEPETEVLLNDGLGTKAGLITSNSLFDILPPGSEGAQNDWFQRIEADDIRPEPFSIELTRNESVFSGQWFIVFNTLDKQSGIDHFEVYETDREREGYAYGKRDTPSTWVRVQSPYVLEDQTLNSIIRVLAIDKAGNQRLAGKIPDESLRVTTKKPLSPVLFYSVLAGVLFLIVLVVVFLMARRRLKRKRVTMEQKEMPPHEMNEGNGFNNEQ